VIQLPTDSIRFVKELYPRLKPADDVIERYRTALDKLPAIAVFSTPLLPFVVSPAPLSPQSGSASANTRRAIETPHR
jgi:hypothetical protein